MSKRRLTISLEARDHERLARIAAREDRSLSWLIALAVKGFLDGAEPQLTIPLEAARSAVRETDS